MWWDKRHKMTWMMRFDIRIWEEIKVDKMQDLRWNVSDEKWFKCLRLCDDTR